MNSTTKYEVYENLALVGIDNPPANALSQTVRNGVLRAIENSELAENVEAIVIYGNGAMFSAGADIREFGSPPLEPFLPDLINRIEACQKPVIAAVHGTVLGGGLEVGLGCHFRVAAEKTALGLPEVKLGLLPGAGGTQRLPRLIPVESALDLITTGRTIDAPEALALGLVDDVSSSADPRQVGIEFAQKVLETGLKANPTRSRPVKNSDGAAFEKHRSKAANSKLGRGAPLKCVEAVQASVEMSFEDGLKTERGLFLELVKSDEHKTLAHTFFAERQVGKIPDLAKGKPRKISEIGVIGGGTMGAGIAVSALLSGFSVTLVERDDPAVSKAESIVTKLLSGAVKRGKLTQADFDAIVQQRFRATDNYDRLQKADLVIEAVFEDMAVKKEVFAKLDDVCKPGAVLATNTSYLDVNDIANATRRPEDVIGLHFFSPAHIMKLLEIVVADKTSAEVVATGFALAKKLGKIGVRSGVCDGFIGNRILSAYRKALDGAILAAASPYDVDRALEGFGLAMGPYAVGDLAGLDIGWATRKRLAPNRDPREIYSEFLDRLCEMGRFGRKTGRGIYIYGDDGAKPDPEVVDIIAAERAEKGIKSRSMDDEEIVDRFVAAMVNEAARIVDEGIALRPLDVDVTLINGYGYPRWRGGPMHYADSIGLKNILNKINRFAEDDAFLWQPARLLERLVADGKSFSSMNF